MICPLSSRQVKYLFISHSLLVTPLYYWNMSGQIRTAIDRLFAPEEGDGNLLRGHDRASALLMATEGHEFKGRNQMISFCPYLTNEFLWC